MEKIVFIHGSSVGQSAFIIKNPANICGDIADKYFKGRILRQKQSAVKFALFVDIYKAFDSKYCAYSFVNNDCFGANGREGQYFAITILCKEFYVYPEVVFQMLESAYDSMLREKRIIKVNGEGKEQYVISQFDEAKDYLAKFLNLIEHGFDSITGGAGKSLSDKIKEADYDKWDGFKVHTGNCNSIDAFNHLCAIGRLYIAEEYESNKTKIVSLQKKVTELEFANSALKQQQSQTQQRKDSTIRKEMDNLKRQIIEKEAEVQKISDENEEYKATIEAIRTELGKYAKVGKRIVDIKYNEEDLPQKGNKELLKIILLFIIFILIILSSMMNYMFFRNYSHGSKMETGEMISANKETVEESNPLESESNKIGIFEISPNHIEADASGYNGTITIMSNNDWECPTNNFNWVTLQKKDDTTLSVKVKAQNSSVERNAIFMVKSGENEKQITVHQNGKINSMEKEVKYNIIVQDDSGKKLKNGDTVRAKQKLVVSVSNPALAHDGFGWRYQNCRGNDNNKNVKSVKVTIGENEQDVIISYGDLGDSKKRTEFILKIEKNIEVDPKPDMDEVEDKETAEKTQETEENGLTEKK